MNSLIKSKTKTLPTKNQSNASSNSIHNEITRVLSQEADAIYNLIDHFPSNAHLLVEKIISTKGKVILSGVGKSGLVAQKLAATFSSIGIPSFSLHPTDSLHGDLGMVQAQDLFIALSKSGGSLEFEHVFDFLDAQGNERILLCCDKGPLSAKADLVIALPLSREACALNLAPTSSSTLMMAFGDAIAVCISKVKKFTKNDFARFHPAGTLGKKLLLKVDSLMQRNEQLPLISSDMLFDDLLVTITQKKLGVGIVVDEAHHLLGIITDGDLRRACKKGPDVFQKTASDIMTVNPKTTSPDVLAYDALKIMEQFNITTLVALDHEVVVGLVHIHDIIKAGLKG